MAAEHAGAADRRASRSLGIESRHTPWRLRDARVAAELTDLGDRARVWRVKTGDGPVVAKLTFDRPGAVEPGLRIAELVEAAGIPTGAPIRTAAAI
ncbi:hypothetical protein [Catenulispora pinisilvae]|uniref:hypothetical protein n=1 Tax=Catenulispora pinisilvae TaxID=2705253 RepID=UPI001892169B|nr:hypothetical protein [Catenulispora pinisilvae]